MNPPQNPHASEARAAMMRHNAPLLQNPPRDEASDAAFIEAALQRWPAMRRYADTARIETAYDAQCDCWREVVTVTVWEREH